MSRKQVLVQLEDDLIEELDELAGELGISRSELIRRAARGLLDVAWEAEQDQKAIDSYTNHPQEDWIVEGGLQLASQLELDPPPEEQEQGEKRG